jgi:hypothetical protein
MSEHIDNGSAESAKLKRINGGIKFGHYLSKKQQQEGKQHRNEEELKPYDTSEVEHIEHGIVAQHRNGDIDKVVRYQYRSQQLLRLS